MASSIDQQWDLPSNSNSYVALFAISCFYCCFTLTQTFTHLTPTPVHSQHAHLYRPTRGGPYANQNFIKPLATIYSAPVKGTPTVKSEIWVEFDMVEQSDGKQIAYIEKFRGTVVSVDGFTFSVDYHDGAKPVVCCFLFLFFLDLDQCCC